MLPTTYHSSYYSNYSVADPPLEDRKSSVTILSEARKASAAAMTVPTNNNGSTGLQGSSKNLGIGNVGDINRTKVKGTRFCPQEIEAMTMLGYTYTGERSAQEDWQNHEEWNSELPSSQTIQTHVRYQSHPPPSIRSPLFRYPPPPPSNVMTGGQIPTRPELISPNSKRDQLRYHSTPAGASFPASYPQTSYLSGYSYKHPSNGHSSSSRPRTLIEIPRQDDSVRQKSRRVSVAESTLDPTCRPFTPASMTNYNNNTAYSCQPSFAASDSSYSAKSGYGGEPNKRNDDMISIIPSSRHQSEVEFLKSCQAELENVGHSLYQVSSSTELNLDCHTPDVDQHAQYCDLEQATNQRARQSEAYHQQGGQDCKGSDSQQVSDQHECAMDKLNDQFLSMASESHARQNFEGSKDLEGNENCFQRKDEWDHMPQDLTSLVSNLDFHEEDMNNNRSSKPNCGAQPTCMSAESSLAPGPSDDNAWKYLKTDSSDIKDNIEKPVGGRFIASEVEMSMEQLNNKKNTTDGIWKEMSEQLKRHYDSLRSNVDNMMDNVDAEPSSKEMNPDQSGISGQTGPARLISGGLLCQDFTIPNEYVTSNFIGDKIRPINLRQEHTDLLFFLFYCCERDALQLIAANLLFERGWRYHKQDRIWVARWPGVKPQEKTPQYEKGLYQYFDVSTWRRIPGWFKLEYNLLCEKTQVPEDLKTLYTRYQSLMKKINTVCDQDPLNPAKGCEEFQNLDSINLLKCLL